MLSTPLWADSAGNKDATEFTTHAYFSGSPCHIVIDTNQPSLRVAQGSQWARRAITQKCDTNAPCDGTTSNRPGASDWALELGRAGGELHYRQRSFRVARDDRWPGRN